MMDGEDVIALGDRWALIVVLLNLRARIVVHQQWPRHARLAWREQAEAREIAFAIGMRWAELDGHRAPLRDARPFEGHVPMPDLIEDVPVLAEAFRDAYCLMAGSPAANVLSVESSERLLLSVFQAASHLGRPEHEVLMLMNEGVLACQWDGGERRVSFKDLESYRVRDREDEATAVEALLIAADLITSESSIRAA